MSDSAPPNPPDFTPPPRAAGPAATPQHVPFELLEEQSPSAEEREASSIQQLMTVAECSEDNARRAYRRCKADFQRALDELLSKRGFVLLIISFCPSQEEYFNSVVRDLPTSDVLTPEVQQLVQNTPVVPYYVRYDEYVVYARTCNWDGFYADIILAGEFAILPESPDARRTCDGGIIGVMTAADGTCPLVDYLNEKLILPPMDGTLGNPFATRHLRQCKYAMHERLKEAGLSYIPSTRVHTADEAVAFIEPILQRNGKIIVKPATGAGSEFVSQCSTEEEVRDAFRVAEGLETTQQSTTEWMVVQEYIEGTEYVVDSVSFQSQHVITDMWLSVKKPFTCVSNRLRSSVEKELLASGVTRPALSTTSLLYDRLDFVPRLQSAEETDEKRRVADYTLKVLDALELINGCAHCELRIRSDGEPVLIELNPRMQGDVPRSTTLVGYDQYIVTALIAHAIMQRIVGERPYPKDRSQPDESATSWCITRSFPRYFDSHDTITRTVLFLRVEENGYVAEPGRKFLTNLPTFVRFTRSTISDPPNPGFINRIRKTTDLYSCPAALVLEGTPEDIERDVSTIRCMENDRVTTSGWSEKLADAATASKEFTRARLVKAAVDAALASRPTDSSDFEEAEDCIDEDMLCSLADSVDTETLSEEMSNLSMEELRYLGDAASVKLQFAHTEALRRIRIAKNCLVSMNPPPLFVNDQEWGLVYAAHCGGALGS